MRKILLLTFIFIQSLTTFSQEIETKPKLNSDDIFLDILFFQESPNFYDDKADHDFAYRFLMTSEEIYEHIYIEKVIYGEEDGSKKLLWRKKLDMDIFFQLGAKGEISNVGFENWTEKESIIITVQEIEYELTNLDSEKWTIKRKN